jgi:hypothetical protein
MFPIINFIHIVIKKFLFRRKITISILFYIKIYKLNDILEYKRENSANIKFKNKRPVPNNIVKI